METIYIIFLTILASGVGTLTGFGASTIMVPVFLFFFPLADTLLLAGVIHFFSDVWKVSFFKEGLRWRLIFVFSVPGIIAAFIGGRIIFSASEILLSRTLGGFFVFYSVFLFLKPSFKLGQNDFTAGLGGFLSGFFAGVFGVGGAIRTAFLAAFDLPKAAHIATAGALGLIVDAVRLTTYITGGARLNSLFFWGLPFFIAASFLGAYISKFIVDEIPQNKFRLIVASFLLIFGVKFILFP